MNPPSEDIKDMLEAESSLGLIFNTNLFIGREPSGTPPGSPHDCVTIFDTYGYPPLVDFDGNANFHSPSIQIRIRNRSYMTGLQLAQNIAQVLHGRHNETWNGSVYMLIVCQNDPGLLDWDESNRARFIVNLNLQRRSV